MDTALAKGGPEATASSFYNCRRCQQCSGGQSNWVLTKRAKVSWCLTSVEKCDKIIRDVVSVYLSSDEKITPDKRYFSPPTNTKIITFQNSSTM